MEIGKVLVLLLYGFVCFSFLYICSSNWASICGTDGVIHFVIVSSDDHYNHDDHGEHDDRDDHDDMIYMISKQVVNTSW